MEKYSVVKCVNGNFAIESEWNDRTKAIARFHKLCETHWVAEDVLDATISVMTERLLTLEGYSEHITHNTPIEE